MGRTPEDERAPVPGPPEATGYVRVPTIPHGHGLWPGFVPAPAPPPKKTIIEQLKDFGPLVAILVVLGTVIGSWKDTKNDVAVLKKNDEERAKKDAQRDADADAAKKSAAAAFSAAADAAKQTRDQGVKLNEVLRKLNITHHRPQRPEQ